MVVSGLELDKIRMAQVNNNDGEHDPIPPVHTSEDAKEIEKLWPRKIVAQQLTEAEGPQENSEATVSQNEPKPGTSWQDSQ